MAKFEELEEFGDDVLELPIHGVTYVIPAVDGATGLWAQRLLETVEAAKEAGDVDAGQLDDDDERLLYQKMLGPTFDEMLDNGVNWQRLGHAAMTVFFWTTTTREQAEAYWKAGGDPNRARSAASPNRASRRASAAAARTTRSRASTSGTKASPTSRKTRGSAGRTSSATGT
jgi:hypothetical protein